LHCQTIDYAPWVNSSATTDEDNATSEVVSIDHFTGRSDIVIPIYNYAIGEYDLGVKFENNNGGIQVDQPSSSVGAGWEVFGGGSIDRQVRGMPDDLRWGGQHTVWVNSAFTRYGYWYSDRSDEEMDIFYANIGNKRFKFMFGKDGSLVTIPKTHVTVKRYVNNTYYPSTIPTSVTNTGNTHFEIIDLSGNTFTFKKGISVEKTETKSECTECIPDVPSETYYYYPMNDGC
jgi:hypothetical protein